MRQNLVCIGVLLSLQVMNYLKLLHEEYTANISWPGDNAGYSC